MTVDAGPRWRGLTLPPLLVMWFDQLTAADLLTVFKHVGDGRYIDVTLTSSKTGSAKPPIVTLK